MSQIEELEGLEAVQEVLRAEFRDGLVDFWSPWCDPCRAMRRHLDKLASEQSARWRFVAVNTVAHAVATESFGVSLRPTIVLFRKEKELHRFDNGVLVSAVADKLEELHEA